MNISSRTSAGKEERDYRLSVKNANSLIVAPEWHVYVKNISKYLERCRQAGRDLEITSFEKISPERNQKLYILFIEKMENTIYNIELKKISTKLRKHIYA